MAPKIYNVNAGESFVDVLAAHFSECYKNQPDELANVVFAAESPRLPKFIRRVCAAERLETDNIAAYFADCRCGRRRSFFNRK